MKRKNGECTACLKYSVLIFVEKKIYKMQHLEGSGTPVLYIGRKVLKGYRNFIRGLWLINLAYSRDKVRV